MKLYSSADTRPNFVEFIKVQRQKCNLKNTRLDELKPYKCLLLAYI